MIIRIPGLDLVEKRSGICDALDFGDTRSHIVGVYLYIFDSQQSANLRDFQIFNTGYFNHIIRYFLTPIPTAIFGGNITISKKR